MGGFINIGFGASTDLRIGVTTMFGSIDKLDTVVLVGVPVSYRLNLSSVYTMMFGANLGIRSDNPTVCTTEFYYTGNSYGTYYPCNKASELGLYVGPEVSFATFRFGSKRQFELALVQGIAFPLTKSQDVDDDHLMILYDNIVFSALFL